MVEVFNLKFAIPHSKIHHFLIAEQTNQEELSIILEKDQILRTFLLQITLPLMELTLVHLLFLTK